MYISVNRIGNQLAVHEIVDGKPICHKVKNFKPEIFISGDEPSDWKAFPTNEEVQRIEFDNLAEYTQFNKQMKDVGGMNVFNKFSPEYQYIRDNYWNKNFEKVKPLIWYLDIETDVNGKFPDPIKAEEKIILIQISNSHDDIDVIFGLDDYEKEVENQKFIKCDSEEQLIDRFVQTYLNFMPSVVTAWNGDNFDTPYIINRMKNLDMDPRVLSPFNRLKEHTVVIFGKHSKIEKPVGVYWIDTMEAYKKIIPGGRESWSLEFISAYHNKENKGKMDWKPYFNTFEAFAKGKYTPNEELLDDEHRESEIYKLYQKSDKTENDKARIKKLAYEMFVEYGRLDSQLLKQLDNTLNLFPTLFDLAWTMGVNVYDTFGTVKPWTQFIANRIYQDKLVSISEPMYDSYKFEGGYVYAEPGLNEWILSFDYTSLYPYCMLVLNLSPETIVQRHEINSWELLQLTQDLYDHRSNEKDIDCVDILLEMSEEKKSRISELLKQENLTMAPNGTFYTIEKQGILPELVKQIFNQRKYHKNLMQDWLKKEQNESDPILKREYKFNAEIENTSQYVMKILINSLYGCASNAHFSLGNSDIASAITSMGRYSIRSTGNYVVEQLNNKNKPCSIIQCDTDSFYISVGKIVKAYVGNTSIEEKVEFIDQMAKQVFKPLIQEITDYNANLLNLFENSLNMDREAIGTMLSTGKKRYAIKLYDDEGTRLKEPKQKIVGLEIKRSSTPAHVRVMLGKVIDLIFEGDNLKLIEFIEQYRKEFPKLRLDEIGTPMGITDYDKYANATKGIPMNVRAGKVHNRILEEKGFNEFQPISSGDKIKFIPLKTPNPIQSDLIGWKDEDFLRSAKLIQYIDYNKQFEKAFISPVQTLLDAIGWKLKDEVTVDEMF